MTSLPQTSGLVVFPGEVAPSQTRELGGKATNLWRLVQAGFDVPTWFAVGAAAHRLARPALADGQGIPPVVREAVLEAFERIFRRDGHYVPVAVRSSAIGEDGTTTSFAGQLKTYLYVAGPEAFLEALAGCWASADASGIAAYRQAHEIASAAIDMAVVVQEMVDSEVSGVAFTANPITGDRSEVVVRAAFGLGEGVVADLVETDGYVIRVPGQDQATEFAAEIAHKTERVARADRGGTRVVPVEADLRDRSCLADGQVRELARTARAIEAAFGSPQDIEWAYAGGRLHVLQARPITVLGAQTGGLAGSSERPEASLASGALRQIVWDNSNIIESYSGVTSALTFSFAQNAYEIVYRQVCELLGVSPRVLVASTAVFRNMLGLMKGRVYYNLQNWYKVVSLLPGFEANRAFMEQMMGVKDSVASTRAQTRAGFVDRIGPLLHVGLRVITNFLTLDRQVAGFMQSFEATYQAQSRQDLSRMSPHEIVEMYDLLEKDVLRNWKAPILTDIAAMVFYGVLRKLVGAWCPEAGDSLQNDLLCGEGGIESTEPTKALLRMAISIKADPALEAEFQSLPPPEADRWLRGDLEARGSKAMLAAAMREFLDRFGFRCMNELKLEEPSLRDDPTFAYVTISNYLRQGELDIAAIEAAERRIRQDAERRAAGALRGHPIRHQVFAWVLANARKAVKNRENLRFARTKIFGLCREMFNALGAKLAAAGQLRTARDIYHLTVPEIIGFVEGRSTCTNLRALAELRSAEFDRYRGEDIPDRFTTTGIPYLDLPQEPAPAGPGEDSGVLSGTSCCPGRVKKAVRVILSPRDDMRLDGQILVAERTDPGWVPLYPSAAGLLIERGSILSHSAIVARELGIPAIVGIKGLTRRVHDGQVVDMDARAGKVYLEAPAPDSAPLRDAAWQG